MSLQTKLASITIGLGIVASQAYPQVAGVARPTDMAPDADIIAFGLRAEGALQAGLQDARPLVEGYFQRFMPVHAAEYPIQSDRIVFGRYTGGGQPVENLLGYTEPGSPASVDAARTDQQLLDGLALLMTPDSKRLASEGYEYTFVKREFLGALRCVEYDVRPRSAAENGFTGRIYLEDKAWNLVRFTGMSPAVDALLAPLRASNSRFRVDSWRVNVARNRWVPAYVYIQEVLPLDASDAPLIKGQVRFWGYDKSSSQQRGVYTEIVLQQSPGTTDARRKQSVSPVESNRRFRREAATNVLNRLYQADLLGSPGEVEKMLDQVLTNLTVSNHLVFSEPVHCRVLLTTPLEAFTASALTRTYPLLLG